MLLQKKIFLISIITLCSKALLAQDKFTDSLGTTKIIDTTITKPFTDSTLLKATQNLYAFKTSAPVPKRAAMYSALLPGLGQAYNKQYWKIPIVYAGLGSAAYLINQQYRNYTTYRKAFIFVTDGNPNTIDTTYSAPQLFSLQKQARNNLDKLGVYTTVFYALNIVDALVASHLRNFDMSKNISFSPCVTPDYVGVKLAIEINNKSHY